MSVLEAARNLGKEIQKDERFIRFAKAKLANDNDEALQKNIGEFNLVRMNFENLKAEDDANEEQINELNNKLRQIYTEIMSAPSMAEYNAAKAELDAVLNDIYSVIGQCVDGADPKTVEPETHCSGSCSTCGGCH